MTSVEISDDEKMFVLHGVQEDVRVDGRSRMGMRPLKFETELVTHANGSAHLRLANTDVLVGVKAELDLDGIHQDDKCPMEFFVDCSANATPDFEGRGGESLAIELSRILAKAYSDKNVFNYDVLKIDNSFSWLLYVDILILEVGGNLYDAVSMAVKAALHSTIIPKVTIATVDGGKPDLEITDDPKDGLRLQVLNSPILITLSRIGHFCVLDPSPEEEACSSSSLVIGVTPSGRVTTVKKCGPGAFNMDSLCKAMQDGIETGIKIQQVLMDKILSEEKMSNKKAIGFLNK